MSLLAQRRAFLKSYRETGSLEAAAAAQGLDPSVHAKWMEDWLYRGAFADIQKEMKLEAAGQVAPPPAPKRIGRPPKPKPENPPPKRPRGRPPRKPPAIASGSPDEPETETARKDAERRGNETESPPEEPQTAPESPAEPPPMVGHLFPGDKGYVRLFVQEGEVPAPPPEPEKPARQAQEPSPDPPLEMTVMTDEAQRALIDEYGELDRRMQLRATDTARYESLKRAIKAWFSNVPADADGTVEGDVYLLHLSACERERKIRSLRELVEVIGLEKVLDLAVVPIGQLENMLGKAHVANLTVECRSGSRRIKAIPKRPAIVQ